MAIGKFVPLSPDPYLNEGADMSLAKFGHLNTIVDYLNGILNITLGRPCFYSGSAWVTL